MWTITKGPTLGPSRTHQTGFHHTEGLIQGRKITNLLYQSLLVKPALTRLQQEVMAHILEQVVLPSNIQAAEGHADPAPYEERVKTGWGAGYPANSGQTAAR